MGCQSLFEPRSRGIKSVPLNDLLPPHIMSSATQTKADAAAVLNPSPRVARKSTEEIRPAFHKMKPLIVVPDSPAERTDAGLAVSEGMRVQARYHGMRWYTGAVRSINADGSCNVEFDDGDEIDAGFEMAPSAITYGVEHGALPPPPSFKASQLAHFECLKF